MFKSIQKYTIIGNRFNETKIDRSCRITNTCVHIFFRYSRHLHFSRAFQCTISKSHKTNTYYKNDKALAKSNEKGIILPKKMYCKKNVDICQQFCVLRCNCREVCRRNTCSSDITVVIFCLSSIEYINSSNNAS